MDAGTHPERGKTRFLLPHLLIELHHLPVDGEACPDRPLRCVLLGDGSAEQRHDPIPRQLVHRSPVLVHLPDEDLVDLVHEGVRLLGVKALRHRSIARHVGEEHRHLLPLPLDTVALGKDLLGQSLREVALDLGELVIDRDLL